MEEKKSKKAYRPIYVKLEEEVHDMLEEYARRTGRTKTIVVERILKKELKKKLEEGIEDF